MSHKRSAAIMLEWLLLQIILVHCLLVPKPWHRNCYKVTSGKKSAHSIIIIVARISLWVFVQCTFTLLLCLHGGDEMAAHQMRFPIELFHFYFIWVLRFVHLRSVPIRKSLFFVLLLSVTEFQNVRFTACLHLIGNQCQLASCPHCNVPIVDSGQHRLVHDLGSTFL